MNRKCSFESLLCGKSEAGGGKEVTQGLLTGGRLLSIPPQRKRDEVPEPARNPQPGKELELQKLTRFFPKILIFRLRYHTCTSLPPI